MQVSKARLLVSSATITPWKLFNEMFMFFLRPFAYFYIVLLKGVRLGAGFKFYGLPKVLRAKNSKIVIGKRFENRNWWCSNPLGVNHPTILCTWEKGAKIKIGDDVGISGGSIVASKSVEIGDGALIGANVLIIDTDFHPISGKDRRYEKAGVKKAAIRIGKNVFLGTGCTILKGAVIPNDTVISAGAVVKRDKRKGYEVI